jgi:hypothetical protein
VNMTHPRSPEEAAFRDRYIKQKQEEWGLLSFVWVGFVSVL